MPPRTNRWKIEPHTQAKHLILARYLKAWLPIMASFNGRILYIDAFAGPGGYSGVPLDLISRIAQNPRCECLINFVYESITRHGGRPEAWIQEHIDQLFGTDKWRALLDSSDPKQRFNQVTELYKDQLINRSRFRHVRTFSMFDQGNQVEYVLFFGTNNRKGLSEMKQAMWKADPLSGQVFSDRTDAGQMVLLQPSNDMGLRYLLQKKFRGNGPVRIEQIEDFVLEHTPYSESMHLKKRTLAPWSKNCHSCSKRPDLHRNKIDGAVILPELQLSFSSFSSPASKQVHPVDVWHLPAANVYSHCHRVSSKAGCRETNDK
jgi:hypothetical protein